MFGAMWRLPTLLAKSPTSESVSNEGESTAGRHCTWIGIASIWPEQERVPLHCSIGRWYVFAYRGLNLGVVQQGVGAY